MNRKSLPVIAQRRVVVLLALAMSAVSALADRMAPIGVFDSGVGGLTVLEKLLTVDVVNNASGEAKPDGVPDLQGVTFECVPDICANEVA